MLIPVLRSHAIASFISFQLVRSDPLTEKEYNVTYIVLLFLPDLQSMSTYMLVTVVLIVKRLAIRLSI